MIYQSKHFSPPNAIKYILKHLQHTFQLIIYHTSRFTHQNAHCSKYITTFQKTIRLLAEHNSIWHSVIYQSKHFSPPNAINYILKHLQHTFQLLIYHTYAYPLNSSWIYIKSQIFQKTIRLLAEHDSNWQFAIYQSKVFSTPNAIKYILKHLQHTFQLLIYHTYAYPLNSSWIYIKSQIFQKTIRLLAEHNSNWKFDIYQSKVFSPPNAIKYILKHLQHTFQLIIYHTSRFTHQNAHCSKYITTFQKTIRLLAEHNSIWHSVITNQNTSHLPTQSIIFWSIFNTLFSY